MNKTFELLTGIELKKSKKNIIIFIIGRLFFYTIFLCLLLIFFKISDNFIRLYKISHVYNLIFLHSFDIFILILPTIVSLSIPFAFLISILLVIFKLKMTNFFYYIIIRKINLKLIFFVGLTVSCFFSFLIYSIRDNLISNTNNEINAELTNLPNIKLKNYFNFNTITQLDHFTLFFPYDYNRNAIDSDSYNGIIYRIGNNASINFIGNGEILKTEDGTIIFKNIYGHSIDSMFSSIKNRRYDNITIFNISKMNTYRKKYLPLFAKLFSNVDFPISNETFNQILIL